MKRTLTAMALLLTLITNAQVMAKKKPANWCSTFSVNSPAYYHDSVPILFVEEVRDNNVGWVYMKYVRGKITTHGWRIGYQIYKEGSGIFEIIERLEELQRVVDSLRHPLPRFNSMLIMSPRNDLDLYRQNDWPTVPDTPMVIRSWDSEPPTNVKIEGGMGPWEIRQGLGDTLISKCDCRFNYPHPKKKRKWQKT